MQKQPWIPRRLVPYLRARKVLGVMVAGRPDPEKYKSLFQAKVIDLIKKAPNLNPIRTYLDLPLNYLNDPQDPEVVFLDMMDLREEWWSPRLHLVMFLMGRAKLDEVKESLYLQEENWDSPKDFRKELEELTLDEFLSLAPQT